MAKTLKHLQPVAWSIEELSEDLRWVSLLKMPIRYQQILADLPRRRDTAPPIRSLHDTLAAASHSIIAFAPEIYKNTESFPSWLYTTADTTLDTNNLRLLFNKWLQTVDNQINKITENAGEHFIWDHIDLNKADYALQRMILPNLIARRLVSQGFQLSLAGHTYPLYLVPIMSQRYVAELITAPIVRENESFSFVLRFWLEHLPYEPTPKLLHKAGIRRWAGDEVKIYYNRSKSLYLRRAAGYLENASRSDVFTRLTVKAFSSKEISYVGKQAEMIELLPLEGELPMIKDFLQNPSAFQATALMPIEGRDSQYTDIKSGLESSDHREIFETLNEALSSFIQPMPLLARMTKGDSRHGSKRILTEDRKTALLAMRIRIEVHSPKHFTKLARSILENVGFSKNSARGPHIKIRNEQNEICLEIFNAKDKYLTDTLSSANANEQERIDYIAKSYPANDIPTGVLIELKDYRKTKLWKQDPKNAIRRGMILQGRLSQFFVPEHESSIDINHRIKNAAADLLRMIGYRHRPFYNYEKTRHLPERLDLLTFWLFQLNKRSSNEKTVYLPVVAEVPFGHPHLCLTIPSASGRSECYPSLYEGIKALSRWSRDFNDDSEIISFFRAAIEERQSKNPALLLLSDSNLQRLFTDELTNFSNDTLSLFGILDTSPQIRVARLRFSENEDAPFCVPPEPRSKYQGLYATHPNVGYFYSLQNVGKKHIHSTKRKVNDLTNASVNPSTVLIQLCNLQKDDDAEEWAGLVHRLRLGSFHTDIPSKLPQPLHDVEAVKKYIPRYQEVYEEEDLNALGEEEN